MKKQILIADKRIELSTKYKKIIESLGHSVIISSKLNEVFKIQLKAMQDAVNQRKGFAAAAEYVESLNERHELSEIIDELSPLLGVTAEIATTLINTAISGCGVDVIG